MHQVWQNIIIQDTLHMTILLFCTTRATRCWLFLPWNQVCKVVHFQIQGLAWRSAVELFEAQRRLRMTQTHVCNLFWGSKLGKGMAKIGRHDRWEWVIRRREAGAERRRWSRRRRRSVDPHESPRHDAPCLTFPPQEMPRQRIAWSIFSCTRCSERQSWLVVKTCEDPAAAVHYWLSQPCGSPVAVGTEALRRMVSIPGFSGTPNWRLESSIWVIIDDNCMWSCLFQYQEVRLLPLQGAEMVYWNSRGHLKEAQTSNQCRFRSPDIDLAPTN